MVLSVVLKRENRGSGSRRNCPHVAKSTRVESRAAWLYTGALSMIPAVPPGTWPFKGIVWIHNGIIRHFYASCADPHPGQWLKAVFLMGSSLYWPILSLSLSPIFSHPPLLLVLFFLPSLLTPSTPWAGAAAVANTWCHVPEPIKSNHAGLTIPWPTDTSSCGIQ